MDETIVATFVGHDAAITDTAKTDGLPSLISLRVMAILPSAAFLATIRRGQCSKGADRKPGIVNVLLLTRYLKQSFNSVRGHTKCQPRTVRMPQGG